VKSNVCCCVLLCCLLQAAGSAFCGGTPSVMTFPTEAMRSGVLELLLLAKKKMSSFNARHKVGLFAVRPALPQCNSVSYMTMRHTV
jgi:hypothetical protein